MELHETRATLPLVHWVDETESTNALMRELAATAEAAAERLPHGTLVATANQTAGRGRQGRDWVTPPDTALSASLLVREDLAAGLGLSWLPLLAGSALVTALQPLFRGPGAAGGARGADGVESAVGAHGAEGADAEGADDADYSSLRVGVKWPNDVHVRGEREAIAGQPGAKLCGILCEVLPGGEVIVGFGVNLMQEDWQLPTERAGSVASCGGNVGAAETLADAGGAALVDRVLHAATAELLRLVALAKSDPASVKRRVLRDSLTVGTEVRVHLPGGEIVDGRAVSLDDDGALVVDRPTTGQLVVHAADVEHLR